MRLQNNYTASSVAFSNLGFESSVILEGSNTAE